MNKNTLAAIRRYFLNRPLSYNMYGGVTYVVREIWFQDDVLHFRGVFYEKKQPTHLLIGADCSAYTEKILRDYFNLTIPVEHKYKENDG